MISYEFTTQKVIAILMDPNEISNELIFWITNKHYPVLRWTRENFFILNMQNFYTTSYGKWWLPIRVLQLILKPNYLQSTFRVLSSQEPFSYIFHYIEDDWVMIDNQQAGKYVSRNSLYTIFM